MKRLKVYEPKGMFQIRKLKRRPLFWRGKIWFTQTLVGRYQLHVGYFHEESQTLFVWKSRDVNPKINHKLVGWRHHPRNPFFDEPVYERVVRMPFLVTA